MKYIFLIIPAILIISCSDNTEPNPDPNSLTQSEILSAANDFTDLLIKTMANSNEYGSENLILSPLSINLALYMTLNGATESTETNMAKVLGLDNYENKNHNSAAAEWVEALDQSQEETVLKFANGVFYDGSKIDLKEDFRNRIKEYYDGSFDKLNFKSPEAIDAINQWAAENTEDRIQKILESIDPMEAMFLINALYIKGDWIEGFPEEATMGGPFELLNGDMIQTDIMFADTHRSVFESEKYTAVDMPLKDSIFSVRFYLPREAMDFSEFINTLDESDWTALLNNSNNEAYESRRIFLRLPKFELSGKYKLKSILQEMGMQEAFEPFEADFSDFGTAAGNIYLSRVLHDTYLKVDERGVEGAAVTTVGVSVTSAPPIVDFNKPFLFSIRHISTNSLIFVGYVVDPRS